MKYVIKWRAVLNMSLESYLLSVRERGVVQNAHKETWWWSSVVQKVIHGKKT